MIFLTIKGGVSKQSYFLFSELNSFKNFEVEVLDHKDNKAEEYWCTMYTNVKPEGIRRDKSEGQIDYIERVFTKLKYGMLL